MVPHRKMRMEAEQVKDLKTPTGIHLKDCYVPQKI
jgi:hypothetical protein